MEFNFLKLVFTLTLEADIADPYMLFGIKADFAELFRRTAGCGRPVCDDCGQAPECPYQQIFSQAMRSDPSAIKRFQKPPLPFAFDLPLLPPVPNRGRRCEIALTLAGLAANHVLLFHDAVAAMFDKAGTRRGRPFTLAKVESVDYRGNRSVVSEQGKGAAPDRLFVLSMEGMEKSFILPADSISLTFVTPLRIIKDGRPLRELSFPALVMPLLRRMSAIAFYYCYQDLDLDYKWLSRLSREAVMSDNRTGWAEWGGNLAGIVGSVTFTGNMSDFHCILLFGEYFHAGKGATYGLGRYCLE